MRNRKRPAARSALPELKVAIIVDPYGSVALDVTGDDEIAEHKKYFSKLLAPRRLRFETPYGVSDTLDADLVVFDFGGMSVGNDLMGSNSRALIRWMQDHPSSLVVVASTFTYRHGLLPELRELGMFIPGEDDGADVYERKVTTPVHNMMLDSKYDEEKEAKIRGWFK
jgi:hypothetical protein